MRKIKFLLMLLCLIATQQLAAYDFIKNGIAYSVTNTATRTVAVVPADSMYGGNIVIPATVTHDNVTYTITSIGDKAFNNYSGIYDENQKLLSVFIPKHVKTIGVEAFRRCVNLKSVNFASDAQLETISFNAFYHCDSLKEVNLPEFLSVIAPSAFSWSGLEKIYIGSNINRIGVSGSTLGSAFGDCHKLNRVDIADIAAYCNMSFNDGSLPNWGKNFYLNGQLITDLVIPSSVTRIPNNSFWGWQGNSVTFPASIEEIGKYAFYGSSIKEVNFPNKTRLQVLGNNAFSYCDSLLRVDLPKSDSLYAAGRYYSDGYWHDGDAFTNCQSLETITVSPSVRVINFSFNPKLKNVIFPSDCHVTQINSQCFECCYALETIEIPNSVTSIGQAIFQSCSSLKKVIIPASVTELSTAGNLGGSYQIHSEFAGCDSLKEVYCYITEPFATGEPYWNDYNWVENVTLYVPQGTKEKYEALYSWNFFGNIVEMGVNVDSLRINKSSLTLTLGTKDTLAVEVYPDNATHKDVVWSISDSTVAKVDNGIVTSIGLGSAVITATTTDGTEISTSCSVTVNAPLATSINLSSTSLTITTGATGQLTATVSPTAASQSVTWKSSNTAVATVSASGLVTAVAPGSATITATTKDGSAKSATCSVTVNAPLATSVSLSSTTLSLTTGATSQLTATVSPATASQSVTWKSSNTAVATVSTAGVVTAVASGTATITATTADGTNKTASCTITVTAPSATSVSLNKTTLSLTTGATGQLTATVSPSTASQSVTWKSSNTAVATVSTAGVVTAVAPGTATITATTADGTNKTASCTLTVKAPSATSVSLNKATLSLTTGATGQLTATVSPTAASQSVTWKSSNTAVATVSTAGVVTAVAPGTVTITATTADGSNKTASCTVTVKSTYTVGDINNDKELNVGDLSRLVKMILDEYSTQDDTFKAADVNGDGELNVGDYSKLVKMILDAPAAGSKAFQGAALSKSYRSAAVSLTSDDIAIGAGQTKLLAVQLSNYDEAFNAVQFDIQLPKDLEIDSEATETAARTSGFGIATNGTRVILSNTRDHAISGSEGDILYLAVKADADIQLGSYEVEFDNVLLSTVESEVVRVDGFYSTIMAEDLTGISSATSKINPQSSKVYDLQGRKVTGKPHKGIYIIDGKKKSL